MRKKNALTMVVFALILGGCAGSFSKQMEGAIGGDVVLGSIYPHNGATQVPINAIITIDVYNGTASYQVYSQDNEGRIHYLSGLRREERDTSGAVDFRRYFFQPSPYFPSQTVIYIDITYFGGSGNKYYTRSWFSTQ